jgi:glycosyltransferase involved in cell wall biosynthesis
MSNIDNTGFSHEYVREVIRPYFDHDYYSVNYDYSGFSDPIDHYIDVGSQLGHNPSADFSGRFYLQNYPDVANSGLNPFFHFIVAGKAEGRLPAPATPIAEPLEPPIGDLLPSEYDAELISACSLSSLNATRIAHAIGRLRSEFDENYYLSRSPDLVGLNIDLFRHYMTFGWKEHRDPNPEFSTAYYLSRYQDIAKSGGNPFSHYVLHGQTEGRKGVSFNQSLLMKEFSPHVSVIVPNFNHARFLRTRIDSILNQSYKNIEIILLDDCSRDASVDIIKEYEREHPGIVRAIINDVNSGSVFAQWRKGIESAKGDLLWICESDDFCENDFLQHCIQPFRDDSVMISFGRIQFVDASGRYYDGLDDYREKAEKGIWAKPFSRFASEWFRKAFAVSNIIPNVGGCLIKRQKIADDIWREVLKFRTSGDWFLYVMLANGGQIAYCPDAIAYFRQHGKNTSVTSFKKGYYYKEHELIITEIRRRWGTPDDVCLRIYINLYTQHKHVNAAREIGELHQHYSNDAVIKTTKSAKHILMCFLGLHLGGGELFPIYLANALLERGYTVSALCLDTRVQEPLVRTMLDSRIAIYDAEFVRERGLNEFVADCGVDIIHTHNARA